MSNVSKQDVEGIVGPDLGVAGTVSGLDIHYDIKGDTKVSGSTLAVEIKLDEKSLERAEKVTGVTRTPKLGSEAVPASAPASQRRVQSDNAYASMFDKKGLSSKVGLSSRRDYRSVMTATSMSPLARVRRRRMLELRRTFDQIAALKNKTVAVNVESLPQAALKKIVEDATTRGDTLTPVGSLSHAMKLAGITPKEAKALKKNTPKNRQWALFVDPNLVPTGWAMD